MSFLSFLIIALAVVAAYILKSLTGFGTALILVPVLSIFFDIKDAIIITALGDVVSSAVLALRDGKFLTLSKLKEVGIGLLLGTALGVSILNIANPIILRYALALFIILYLIVQHQLPTLTFKSEMVKRAAGYAFGFLGGICGGIFNTNGPALVMYMKSAFTIKEVIRANLVVLFLIDSIWRTSLYAVSGNLTVSSLLTFAIMILPALLIGLYIGTKIDQKMKSEHYTTLSKLVLALSGIKLLAG